jgi:hypothetical protein
MKTLRITLWAVISLTFPVLSHGQIPPVDSDVPQVKAYKLPLPLDSRPTIERSGVPKIDIDAIVDDAFGQSQDRLTKISARREEVRKKNAELSFHDQEIQRLLIPKKSRLGMLCVPSFTPEWAITYNSSTHTLTLKESEQNIWYLRYHFDHWDEYTHNPGVERPKRYESPKVQTHTLRISADMTSLLTSIWGNGIGTAVEPNPNILIMDGVTYEFFINGRRANTRSEKNAYATFANALKDAIFAGDKTRAETLICSEFQRVVSGLSVE